MRRFAFAASLFLFPGCAGKGMVRVPSDDPSPPQASLYVGGSAGPLQLAPGGGIGRIELGLGDSLVLLGDAVDPGGVRAISLLGSARVTCLDTATGARFSRSTGFLRRHVPGSYPAAYAPIRRDYRFILRVGDLARLCRSARPQSAVGLARLEAANFHGGSSATPRLEFRAALSDVAEADIRAPAADTVSARCCPWKPPPAVEDETPPRKEAAPGPRARRTQTPQIRKG
jgi:hypothetical protein